MIHLCKAPVSGKFVCLYVRSELLNPLTDLPQILVREQRECSNLGLNSKSSVIDFFSESLVSRPSWVPNLVLNILVNVTLGRVLRILIPVWSQANKQVNKQVNSREFGKESLFND